MGKLLLLCAVFLGFTITVAAQTANQAELKLKKDQYDFGKVPQGKPVTVNFDFQNGSKEPLILTDVKPTCDCTIADYTKAPLKKGERGVIKVTYNAMSAGPFNKTIVVTSNAKTPSKYLVISGEVIATGAALNASTDK